MTGGRRRIREFRRKRETAHLTRFKQSGTSRLPSEARRRPFIRCASPPGGGGGRSSISSSFYQFFLKHQLFRTARRPQRRLQLRRWLRKRCLHIGNGETEQPRSGVLRRQRRAAERYLITAPDRLLSSFTYERPLYRGLADQTNCGGASGSPLGPKLWLRCGRCGAAEGSDALN